MRDQIRAYLIEAYRQTPHWHTKTPGKPNRRALDQAHAMLVGIDLGLKLADPLHKGISGLVFLSQVRDPFDALKITKEDLT